MKDSEGKRKLLPAVDNDLAKIEIVPKSAALDQKSLKRIKKVWDAFCENIEQHAPSLSGEALENIRSRISQPSIANQEKSESIEKLRRENRLESQYSENEKKLDLRLKEVEIEIKEQNLRHNQQKQILEFVESLNHMGMDIRSFIGDDELISLVFELLPLKSVRDKKVE